MVLVRGTVGGLEARRDLLDLDCDRGYCTTPWRKKQYAGPAYLECVCVI